MYEVFVYKDKMSQLHGNYWGVAHVSNIPYGGQAVGDDWVVDEVTEVFGIIDVVLRRR